MGLKNKRSHPWLSRLHFLVRFVGVTGLAAAVVGLVLAQIQGRFGGAGADWQQRFQDLGRWLADAARGQASGDTLSRVTAWVLLAGGAAALLGLLVEALVVLRLTAGRRSALGFNAAVQVALAVVLLIGVNVFSFGHYLRFDCTRDREFTLPAPVREQLGRLRGKTTIVVLQHRAAEGNVKLKRFAAAAEAVVIDKVRDLAEQLREQGPQFEVVLLDPEHEDYEDKLAEVTKDKPKLARALENARGNSIFFYATSGEDEGKKEHVQRLSFDDFYQLDRGLSFEGGGKGNLVLLKKGVEPLLTRILNLEEKRPRIAILVPHEALSTEGQSQNLGLQGLKKTLTAHGFEVRNVVIKRWVFEPRRGWRGAPAADTLEETRYGRLSNRQDSLEKMVLPQLEARVKVEEKRQKVWKDATPAKLRDYARQLGVPEITEKQRQQQVEAFGRRADSIRALIAEQQQELKEVQEQLAKLDPDLIGERQHMSDPNAKLRQTLADCDLLLIPRMTVTADDTVLRDDLFRMASPQVAIVKEFLKEGKPLLACLGPLVDPRSQATPNALEDLLSELGITASKETVVYETQAQDAEERKLSPFVTAPRPVPPLDLETPLAKLRPLSGKEAVAREDNPLRRSLGLARRARGGGLDLRLRYPRPVSYKGERAGAAGGAGLFSPPLPPSAVSAALAGPGRSAVAPAFLWTGVACKSEKDPLDLEETKKEDPTRGAGDEHPRSPFPVGVAIQAKLPEDWYADGGGTPKTVRVAVIGHGSVFAEPELSPGRAKLLLDTCNWLTGRDDLLTKEVGTWTYPRLELSERDRGLWLWGTRLGLPALFAYLGLVVLLARRVR